MPIYSGKTPCIKIHKARIRFSASGIYKALYGNQPSAAVFAPFVCPCLPLAGRDVFFFFYVNMLLVF